MKKKEIEDRFKEEREQVHDLYNVTLETLENQNVADFSVKHSKSQNAISTSESQKFVPKKHPIQTKNTTLTNGYYENQFTYIPGYLISPEGSQAKQSILKKSNS